MKIVKSPKRNNIFRHVFGMTIDEWNKKADMVIMDPDGFDRTDPDLYERKFYKKELLYGTGMSTVIPKRKNR